MTVKRLPCLFLFGTSVLLTASAPPKPASLSRAGETTIFSFASKGGKTVALCRGPKGAYLVYRFGTAANVELQYPAKLDAGSWKKFTYWSYHRGNPYLSIAQLRFENEGVKYTFIDHTEVAYNKQEVDGFPRRVSVLVTMKGRDAWIVGNSDAAVGELETVSNDHKVKLDEGMKGEAN